MKKKLFTIFAISVSFATFSQIGINTKDPESTFDVQAKFPIGNNNNVDGLLIPRVSRERAQKMTNIPVSTLIYVNNVTTGTATGIAVNIDYYGYYYFNGISWVKLNNNEGSNVIMQSYQLRIPPHQQWVMDFTNHNNASYDSDNWQVISKTSVNSGVGTPPRMTIVYEYQGTPFSNLDKILPQLTIGNNTTAPDIFSLAFINLANVGDKTRLTVSVSRTDNLTYQWSETFLLNVLLAIKN